MGRIASRWILGLCLFSALLAGCNLLSKAGPTVATVTLTDKVDERTKAALTPLLTFPPNSTEFYASVKVMDPQKGTKVKARWLYNDLPIDEYEITFSITGDRHVAFNLTASAGKTFPTGSYKVLIFLNESKVSETPFTVQ
jgi:hypothetical protein